MPFLDSLHKVVARADLTREEAREAMLAILDGAVSTSLIAAFAVALRMKGETGTELLGLALAMRERATPVRVEVDGPLLDTCGTGGDGGGTFNVSTVAAFVVAGAGVAVAKHGNRSLSSQCGSADVLEELGVTIPMTPQSAARAIQEIGIGFLFAPSIHPAMKHAQPARVELKMRTVFNLLGPLCNPAGATAQLIGAPSAAAAELMAEAAMGLGIGRAFVVHGEDGMDEITTTAPTTLWRTEQGSIEKSVITPEDFGVARASREQLQGGDRAVNAAIARRILEDEPGAKRDIVLVNAAAALVVAGKAAGWKQGMELARASIASGKALQTLIALTKVK
ncbi:MAG: anthranilate phosphoribosyltransferase [Candidatus Solibacter usitatus]|nr:anthranilate phosphoribosyltransferase [Candidatus Solibacter usitatus]